MRVRLTLKSGWVKLVRQFCKLLLVKAPESWLHGRGISSSKKTPQGLAANFTINSHRINNDRNEFRLGL